jgi:hypothetical protein
MIKQGPGVEAFMVRVAVAEMMELVAIGLFLAGIGVMGAALNLA